MSEIDEKKLAARELLIKAKVYRVLSIVFLIVGLIALGVIYVQISGGDITVALQNPALIIAVLITFLPASVLSLLAKKSEKKLAVIVESMTDKKAD